MSVEFDDLAWPDAVGDVIGCLAGSTGVRAITVGGSRATGTAAPESDWDLGVFYRGSVDLSTLATFGDVHPPGSWGRLMNGGAWLTVGNVDIDVILRDLDTVEFWTDRASEGTYEVDQLLGHLAGFPTYTLTAEVALSLVVFGSLDVETAYPDALVSNALERWAFQRDFSVDYALMHARRGNEIGVLGNLARASMEEAHRRMCSNREWVLNEKHLLAQSGLDGTVAFRPAEGDLIALVERFAASLR